MSSTYVGPRVIPMEVNKLVFGGLALGCLAAAMAGGYMAARQAPDVPQAAISALEVPAGGEPVVPVTESEGVIVPDEAEARPAAAAPAARTPAPAPRRESPARPARVERAPERRVEPAAPARRPARVADAAPIRDRTARTARGVPEASARASSEPATLGGMWETRPTVTPERAPIVEPEPPPPPAPEFVDLVVPTDSVLGLQIERTVSSEHARVEDRVEARITRDVRVGDRVAIPAGAIAQGSVIEVERGGKIKEQARLGVRFHTIVLADGTRLNIRTEPVMRDGPSPAKESAAKIGGAAVGGAILGAILGGGKGAIIGGATGAAGGTAASMSGDRNPAVLTQGTTVSVRVLQPVTVTVEK